ncbi:hypothetical protein KEM56_007049 [Ascosphaera pollenicola]|nr:hypothetical protein KEM56_007049 [Ascosphaera pollenicola]
MATVPKSDVKKPSMLEEETRLQRALAAKDVNFGDVNTLLAALRSACRGPLIQNIVGARPNAAPGLGGRLWEAHLKVNMRFRKALSLMHETRSRKRTPVEPRKLEAHYIHFIKASQRFYRELIAHIRSLFEPVHEVELIAAAHEFQYERYHNYGPKRKVDDATREKILTTCRATLIRLGDLSRYREMELTTNPRLRKWDKAIAYYTLASTICPESGMPQNQLAIIGLAEGNHLEATYRLYRSAASRDPHPSAPENLHIEFKKILAAWTRGEPLSIVNDVKSSVVSLFIYFHAKCAQGHNFTEREELTSEILGQIQVDLKEGAFERSLLQKFALINIAAEHQAHVNAARSSSRKEKQLFNNALSFFRQLNMRFFLDLAVLLVSEVSNAGGSGNAQMITPAMRCILPTLRHYSSWLQSSHDFKLSSGEHASSETRMKELFKTYAEALSALTSTFDIVQVGEVVTYLLEEDEEILGFVPLSNKFTTERFENDDGQQKARLHSINERQPEDLEMMFRIKELVREGLALVVSQKIPILLLDKNNVATFIHKDDYTPEPALTDSTSMAPGLVQPKQPQYVVQPVRAAPCPGDSEGVTNAASMSYSLAMDRMVDNLVDSDMPNGAGQALGVPAQMREDQHLHRPRLASLSAGNAAQGHFPPAAESNYTSYSPPALPSILNTPFAPQPSDAFLGGADAVHFPPAPGQAFPLAPQAHPVSTPLRSRNPSLSSSHMQSLRQKSISNPPGLAFSPEPSHVNGYPRGGQSFVTPPPGLAVNAPIASAGNAQFGSVPPFNNVLTHYMNSNVSTLPFNDQRFPSAFFQPNQRWGGATVENLWSTEKPGFGAVGSGRRQGD